MGSCCNAHLADKIRDYAQYARNGEVTVSIIAGELPQGATPAACDYCKARAVFTCSYFSK